MRVPVAEGFGSGRLKKEERRWLEEYRGGLIEGSTDALGASAMPGLDRYAAFGVFIRSRVSCLRSFLGSGPRWRWN